MKTCMIVGLSILLLGLQIPASTELFYAEISDDGWMYDEDSGWLSINFSGKIHESYVLKFGIVNPSLVGVLFTHTYLLPEMAEGCIESSRDHGETWLNLADYAGEWTKGKNVYTTITSNSLWIRFTVGSEQGSGCWRIWDIQLIGDTRGTPPKSSITISGCPCDIYWYPTPINSRIRSKDIAGIKSIHCIDNFFGEEYKIQGCDELHFIISSSGHHQLVYWAVDGLGNEEAPHTFPMFGIDSGEPPTVNITKPKPGLYCFGKKLPIEINETIFIGGFRIIVNASDITSGIRSVRLFLDGDLIGECTNFPCQLSVDEPHFGKGTLTAWADDIMGNSAEDLLEIFYYNFF